jgi:fused signal recognition particle receptor
MKEKKAAGASGATPPSDEPRGSFFGRLKERLSKTRENLTEGIERLFLNHADTDFRRIEELEELLITSDLGVESTDFLVETVKRKASHISSAEDLKKILKEEMLAFFATHREAEERGRKAAPHVVLIVGVNGVGKTTTIGKLAARFIGRGNKVIFAATDTFRAAAAEQLSIWAERTGADIVRHKDMADPASVAFDCIEAAVSRGSDIVLVDTAGRLHTKVNLMEELKKVKRTISKRLPGAPHETLLVLDATTGQNALSQAKLFHEALGITGLVLAKLDGTARGGIAFSICRTLGIPLRYIGVGEGVDDLREFDPVQFLDAIFNSGEKDSIKT